MSNIKFNPNQKELKIALVLDNYKLSNKSDWWVKSLKQTPWIEDNYELVKETISFGITKGTMNCYRYYKLKEPIK